MVTFWKVRDRKWTTSRRSKKLATSFLGTPSKYWGFSFPEKIPLQSWGNRKKNMQVYSRLFKALNWIASEIQRFALINSQGHPPNDFMAWFAEKMTSHARTTRKNLINHKNFYYTLIILYNNYLYRLNLLRLNYYWD